MNRPEMTEEQKNEAMIQGNAKKVVKSILEKDAEIKL